MANGAALELQGNIAIGAEGITLNGSGVNGGGALRNVNGSNSSAGAFILASDSTITTVAGTLTLGASSSITGATHALTKAGNGTLTLAGTQAYSTLTTSGGTTNVESAIGTGSSSVIANATTSFFASQTLASLSIGAGAVVSFASGPAPALGGPAGSVVPEPGSIGLLLVGALGLLGRRRRSRPIRNEFNVAA